jgi:anti-sigma regulatory factor (Ser/Thr protein kinase)
VLVGGPPIADDVISMVLMADPVSLSVVRDRFRRWLAELCWPPREVDDIVTAVNEAVSDAVEHAPVGAEVRVAARPFAEADGGRRVVVGVSDDRRRRPPPADPHGYGLLMIHACMDTVELCRESGGTTMLMTSVRVPPR